MYVETKAKKGTYFLHIKLLQKIPSIYFSREKAASTQIIHYFSFPQISEKTFATFCTAWTPMRCGNGPAVVFQCSSRKADPFLSSTA